MRVIKQPAIGVAVLLLAFAVCLPGCGGGTPPRLEVKPVVGKLLVDGQPAVRAEVSLQPITDMEEPTHKLILPLAVVETDGTFRPSTYLTGDGVPKGQYAVLVTWPEVTVAGGEEVRGEDRLRGRFNDPLRPAAMIEVTDATDSLPTIELKTR